MVTVTAAQREALRSILARKGYDADTMQVARRDLAVTAKIDPNKTHRADTDNGARYLVGYADELLWHDEAEAERRKVIHG